MSIAADQEGNDMATIIKSEFIIPLTDKKKTQVTLLEQGAEIASLKFLKMTIHPEHDAEVYQQLWNTPWKDVQTEMMMFPHEEYISLSGNSERVSEIAQLLNLSGVIELKEQTLFERYLNYCEEYKKEPQKIISFRYKN